MVNKAELGKMLRQRRLLAPLTLHQLSAKSGLSMSHLARVERGERFPSARTLHKVAGPLGLSEAELLTQAGFLSPTAANQPVPGQLDPYVQHVLSQEPVETQRAVIAILSILKSMAKGVNL